MGRLLLLALLCWWPPLQAAPKPLQLALTADRGSQRERVATAVATELFRRAGVTYQIHYLPSARAQLELHSGKLDGDLLRGPAFAKQVPQMLRVEPAYTAFSFRVFTSVGAPPLDSWAQLERVPFAYRRGLVTVEQATPRAKQRYPVDSDLACLLMVANKRLAACVTNDDSGNQPLPPPYGEGIVAGRVLDGSEVFIYLAPQHKALAATLSKLLQQMEHSGELARLVAAAGR